MASNLVDILSTAALGYLIGSLPIAYVVGRFASGVDVRVAGEGNVGARNVFHVVGPGWGIAAFVGDFAKGAAVAALFRTSPDWQLAVATTAAVVGHGYPVWLRFVGGKGLSLAGGVAAVLMPLGVLVGISAAGIAWLLTRRFLPTTVVVIVVSIVSGPLLGASIATATLVVWLFAITGAKRAADEARMRRIEAATGWDRSRGLRA